MYLHTIMVYGYAYRLTRCDPLDNLAYIFLYISVLLYEF